MGPVVAPGLLVTEVLTALSAGDLHLRRKKVQVCAAKRESHKITEHGCGELCKCARSGYSMSDALQGTTPACACTCGEDMGKIKARETLTPVSPDKEVNREIEGVAGWTALGRYYAQPFTIMAATAVLKKAQIFTKQTRASQPLRAVLLSSDVSGWSPTKDVIAEGRVAARVARAFSGGCMPLAWQVQSGYHIRISRLGLSSEWFQQRGGYQGQDGKWSSLYHEAVSVSNLMCQIALNRLPTGTTLRGLTVIDDNIESAELPHPLPPAEMSEQCKSYLTHSREHYVRSANELDKDKTIVAPRMWHFAGTTALWGAYASKGIAGVEVRACGGLQALVNGRESAGHIGHSSLMHRRRLQARIGCTPRDEAYRQGVVCCGRCN